MAAYTPSQPSGGAGFSLKLKLGSTTHNPPAAAAPTPAPPSFDHSGLSQLANSALQHEMAPPAPIAAPAPSAQGGGQQQQWSAEGSRQGEVDEREARGVTSAKYRELKRKYNEVVESRDETSLALFRSQKLIHRLREEKTSLLDRVLLLESAAGLTSTEVDTAEEEVVRSAHAAAFPLLQPPSLPSLADRPIPTPVLNTSTDLSHSSYNDPIGEPPRPLSFPPRQRSQHLRSRLASQKLRNDTEARRAAQGLPKPAFPAVSVLGLNGSYVAENVERAMMGEHFGEPGAYVQEQKPVIGGGGGSKRRRESESAGLSGRSRSRAAEPQVAAFHGLPNPFAGAGATPIPGYAEEAPQTGYYAAAGGQRGGDVDMDDGGSYGEAAGYSEDDGGDSKEYQPKERKQQHKSEGQKTAKAKRPKAQGLTSGTYQIPHIPRNPDGTPRLPIPIGIMILRKLGTVTPREKFHTERYIFPIGYEAMRKYPSMIDRTETVEYACTIVDGGDGHPHFEIHPADQPGVIISAATPTGAWSQVVKAANRVRERNHSNSVSGPDYYGHSHNIVKALIQELPGARELPGYIWQNFVEDSEPMEETGRRGKRGEGSRRVTGGRRKARLDSEGQEDGGYDQQQYQYQPHHQHQPGQYGSAADSNNGYESSQRSPSPVTSPGAYSNHHDGYNAPSSSSLSALLHHAAQAQAQVAADPYALPGAPPPVGHRSPSFSASPYAIPGVLPPPPHDPYAIPPPAGHQNAYSQPLPTGGSSQVQPGGWQGAVDPMFQQQGPPPPQQQQQPPPPAALDPSFH